MNPLMLFTTTSNSKKILFYFLVFCCMPLVSGAKDFSTFEKQYYIESKPYVVFNFKSSDCINCSIIAVNKINNIRNKKRIIILFESSTMKYFENKYALKLNGCKIIYDSLFSYSLCNSSFNTLSLVTESDTKLYHITDLNANVTDSINNILDSSRNYSDLARKDSITTKLVESFNFNNKSLFTFKGGFGLFDYRMQQGFIEKNKIRSKIEPALSSAYIKKLRSKVLDKKFSIKDSVQDVLLEQTGFPTFQIKGLFFDDIMAIGININTLTNKSPTADTNLNLKLQSNLVIATTEKMDTSEIFNFDHYQIIYPLNIIEVGSKKFYPTLSHGFAITRNHIYVPYNEYISGSNQNSIHHILGILNYKDSSATLMDTIGLKYWDDNPTERIAIKLDTFQNAIIGYLNSKNIYFHRNKRQIVLNEMEDDSQILKNGELMDFKVIQGALKVLINSNHKITEYTIDIVSEKIISLNALAPSNIVFAKYHSNKINCVQKTEGEYKLFEF